MKQKLWTYKLLLPLIIIYSCNNETLENTEISFNKEDIYGEWIIESANNPFNEKTFYIYNDGKVMSNDIDFLKTYSGSIECVKDSVFLFKRAYYKVYAYLISYDHIKKSITFQFSKGNGNFFDNMKLSIKKVSTELPNPNKFIYDGCYITGSYIEKFITPSEISAKIKDNSIMFCFNGNVITSINPEFIDLISKCGDTCCITEKPINIEDNMPTYTAITNEITNIDIFILSDHNRISNLNRFFEIFSYEDYGKFISNKYNTLEPYRCNASILSHNFPIECGRDRIQLKCLDSNIMKEIKLNGACIDFTFKNIINGNEEKISTKIYH